MDALREEVLTAGGKVRRTGLLLVGHGTSSPLGTAEFAVVVQGLRKHFKDHPLAFGFLEHARPSIADGLEVLCRQGVTKVLGIPVLLFAAGHAKRDIPAAIASTAHRVGIQVVGQAEVLGCHPLLIELSLKRFAEKIGDSAPTPAFVLVGRGNRDFEAQEEARRFLSLCQKSGQLPLAELGYLSMAEPSIEEILEQVADLAPPRCVLVPHLLFHGQLSEKCGQLASEFAARRPKTNWSVARRLGPDSLVISAVADRIRSAEMSQQLGN